MSPAPLAPTMSPQVVADSLTPQVANLPQVIPATSRHSPISAQSVDTGCSSSSSSSNSSEETGDTPSSSRTPAVSELPRRESRQSPETSRWPSQTGDILTPQPTATQSLPTPELSPECNMSANCIQSSPTSYEPPPQLTQLSPTLPPPNDGRSSYRSSSPQPRCQSPQHISRLSPTQPPLPLITEPSTQQTRSSPPPRGIAATGESTSSESTSAASIPQLSGHAEQPTLHTVPGGSRSVIEAPPPVQEGGSLVSGRCSHHRVSRIIMKLTYLLFQLCNQLSGQKSSIDDSATIFLHLHQLFSLYHVFSSPVEDYT